MSERKTRSSRHLQPSRNKKLDKLLNVLIGIVVILIIITATFVFKWQDDAGKAEKDEPKQEQTKDKEDVKEEPSKEQNNDVAAQEEKPTKDESSKETQTSEEEATTETTSDNPIVDKVITNKTWQPTPTTQTGQHVSSYDGESVDWSEKVATVTAATGIDKDNMIIWRMGNNGSANSAIATVSTKDKTKMYRVSMEWVDNEGWLPVKLEQLNTLNGAY
ncbi:YrrS family protein [Lysinibacillus sp. BPa_S21]|uniref:YrrS family protein n=1 Tax=Lysinibacillus sp. BPa_S21 TaxID=2932478 RepID=UPI002011DBA4|nr:YrrS family protein [Lysinibacillus sp. BPa_S21]MCL1694959.1 YrrS family protein [Lysinibacillus sp. BPa_S21]